MINFIACATNYSIMHVHNNFLPFSMIFSFFFSFFFILYICKIMGDLENKTKDNNSLQATDYCYCLVLYQLRKRKENDKNISKAEIIKYIKDYIENIFIILHLFRSIWVIISHNFYFYIRKFIYEKLYSVHSGNLRLNEDIKENDDCIFNLFYFLLYCKWDIFIIIFKYFPGIKWLNVYYKELFRYIILQRIYIIYNKDFLYDKINSRELFFDISNLLKIVGMF